MRCCYITQELAPYFAEGGLGVTSATLPALLQNSFGIEHTLVLPYYPWLVRQHGIETKVLASLPPLTAGNHTAAAEIHQVVAPQLACEVLLVRADSWYNRPSGLYRDAQYEEYPDAVERAAFFGHCVAAWIAQAPSRYQLIHGNDWQSGLALFLIARARTMWQHRPGLLYNIHNGEYQGIITPQLLPLLGLPPGDLRLLEDVIQGQPSSMLLGALGADALVTGSPTYARELTEALAEQPLGTAIQRLGLRGIVAGIDPALWNPAWTEGPAAPYSASDVAAGKRRNKQLLQQHFGLRIDPDVPLYGICGRLVHEKGIDLVLDALRQLPPANSPQLIVMGVGLAEYRDALRQLAIERPGTLHYEPAFQMPLARLLYAGCDYSLMPSRVEPCGLNQLIAMRYGTLPIVSRVGGLNDTVVDLRQHAAGTGLALPDLTTEALLETLDVAADWLRERPKAILAARQRAMEQDWSWQRTAGDFAMLYHTLVQHAKMSASSTTGA